MDGVEAQLLEALAAHSGSSPHLSDDLTALGIDSVDMAGFIRELEQQFEIRVDEEVFDIVTVADLIHYVEMRREV